MITCVQCKLVSITHPATYSSARLEALKSTFDAAGLTVFLAISKPVAAAIHEMSPEKAQLDLQEHDHLFTIKEVVMFLQVKLGLLWAQFMDCCSGGFADGKNYS